MMNGFCCSKDESGTLRCPKSAKFAVTSETNSCVTFNEIPEEDEFVTDGLEVEGDIDADTTMIIDTPQAGFLSFTGTYLVSDEIRLLLFHSVAAGIFSENIFSGSTKL